MTLESIRYTFGKMDILDQLLLPRESVYISIETCEDAWDAIKNMKIRGAPAIAVVGVLSIAVELTKKEFASSDLLYNFVIEKLNYLLSARPTAVNARNCRDKFVTFIDNLKNFNFSTVNDAKLAIIAEIEKYQKDDILCNISIGSHGAKDLISKCIDPSRIVILTHCNTGSLATAAYGTALGVVRALHEKNTLEHCYFTETRPYNQGARLTSYELLHENIPSTLVCDNMVAALMKERKITAVITGADCVSANGDTANKIGTYQIAIIAKYHNVPFYIAAPVSSINLKIKSGEDITIEERPSEELTYIDKIRIAPQGVKCWNPAFDVTPAELISGGIITEFGVFPPVDLLDNLRKYI